MVAEVDGNALLELEDLEAVGRVTTVLLLVLLLEALESEALENALDTREDVVAARLIVEVVAVEVIEMTELAVESEVPSAVKVVLAEADMRLDELATKELRGAELLAESEVCWPDAINLLVVWMDPTPLTMLTEV